MTRTLGVCGKSVVDWGVPRSVCVCLSPRSPGEEALANAVSRAVTLYVTAEPTVWLWLHAVAGCVHPRELANQCR